MVLLAASHPAVLPPCSCARKCSKKHGKKWNDNYGKNYGKKWNDDDDDDWYYKVRSSSSGRSFMPKRNNACRAMRSCVTATLADAVMWWLQHGQRQFLRASVPAGRMTYVRRVTDEEGQLLQQAAELVSQEWTPSAMQNGKKIRKVLG